MYKCPKCGKSRFAATALVQQDWELNHLADFVRVRDECIQVIKSPDSDDDNTWDCLECSYSGKMRDFRVM